MESRVLLSAVFVIACFVADAYAAMKLDCSDPEGWVAMSVTTGDAEKQRKGDIELDADAIETGKPFSFNVRFCPKEHTLPERVVADATMPAHKHGMNYNPTVTLDEETGQYKVENFVFHMPGEWEVTLSAYDGEAVTHYVHNVTVD